ncbi:hypothetical protein [Clostridium sp. UBA5712]|uniref:hypothetical protein n=1 Tax=Clostridium sp. UBA5712 TaxID=1946368 RepID=UPI003216C583
MVMAIEYSSNETIQSYDNVFRKFNEKIEDYNELDNNSKLIYLTAGLGLTNSIHERFIKSIIYEYTNLYELSENKKKLVIRKYKSPKGIKGFVELLSLDLEEAFELNKLEIKDKFFIDSVDNLINMLEIQRDVRNDYLHGDFNFHDDILFEIFKDNVLEFQQLHSFILKITRYSFLNNLNKLPDISSIL